MADKQATALPSAGTLDGTEVLYVVKGSNSRKTTTADFLTLLDQIQESTDSETIGTGPKTFTFTTAFPVLVPWIVGQRIRAVNGVNVWMEGEVSAVSTTSVTIEVDLTLGSGTYAVWELIPIGEPGEQGATPEVVRSSVDSFAIGTGPLTFTYTVAALNIGWTVGTRLRAYYDATNYMEGVITAVTGVDVDIDIDYTVGSGTYATWELTIAGSTGPAGPAGDVTRLSTTSLALGTGSKSLTYTVASSNIGWAIGTRLRFYYDATNYMEGVVTAVSSTAVTITSDRVVGSGTYASWSIGIAGDPGAAGSSWPGFTIINKTGSYTAVSGDFSGNKIIEFDSASAVNFTVDTGLTGTEPLLVYQKGAGQVTVNGTATRRARNGSKTGGQYALISVVPMGSNIYIIAGDTTT